MNSFLHIHITQFIINPFTPEFMKQTLPPPNSVTSVVANWGLAKQSEIAINVDLDEKTRYRSALFKTVYEAAPDKTYNQNCATSKDLHQPAHRSLC